MAENESNDGSYNVDVSDAGGKTFTQDEVNKIAARARAEGARERSQPTSREPSRLDRVESALEKLTSAIVGKQPDPAWDPAKAGAAAPLAPNGPVNPMSLGGIPDLFNFSEAQLDQLGHQGLREMHEKILDVGRQRMGAPRVPTQLQRKK